MYETILKTKDICERLRISRTTFWRLRRSGKFPQATHVGGFLRGWKESDFGLWIDANFPPPKIKLNKAV